MKIIILLISVVCVPLRAMEEEKDHPKSFVVWEQRGTQVRLTRRPFTKTEEIKAEVSPVAPSKIEVHKASASQESQGWSRTLWSVLLQWPL